MGPQHPAHGGEGEKELGQEDVSQGNKVIEWEPVKALPGRSLHPKAKTWDLMPFLLRRVKITVWPAIPKAAGAFQARGASSNLGHKEQS